MFVRDAISLARTPATDTANQADWDETVRWALGRLAPVLREAFLLKHVEDMEYDEMSQFTGVGVSALKMRVKRACERLRILLTEVERV